MRWTVRGLEKSGSQLRNEHNMRAQDDIVDPQDLDLEPGHREPDLCSWTWA